MGVYGFPFDAVSGAPSYTGRMLRQMLGGLWTKTSTSSLRTRSGIHPATPTTTVTASSTTWTVLPHGGVLDLEASAIAGPYFYSIDTNQTGSVNAAHATLARVDLLSIRLDDPAEGDGTSVPAVAVVYTAGTAAGTPVPPATPARSMPLAWISVPASGGGSPTTALIADRAVAVGGITPTPVGTSNPSAPYVGQYRDDPTAGLMRWSGSLWVAVVAAKPQGSVAYTVLDTTQARTGTTTFGATVSPAPIVGAQVNTAGNHSVNITNVTTTNFSWRVFRTPGDNAPTDQPGTFNWWVV